MTHWRRGEGEGEGEGREGGEGEGEGEGERGGEGDEGGGEGEVFIQSASHYSVCDGLSCGWQINLAQNSVQKCEVMLT